MNGKSYRVLDLSEEGIRFRNSLTSELSIHNTITGTLNFKDGEVFLIRGTVTRLTHDEVGLKLKTPIPLRKIMSEQRTIIGKHTKAS